MDVDLGKDSSDGVCIDQSGNVLVGVLDAAVHVDLRGYMFCFFLDSLGCLNDEFCSRIRIEGQIDTPRQDKHQCTNKLVKPYQPLRVSVRFQLL